MGMECMENSVLVGGKLLRAAFERRAEGSYSGHVYWGDRRLSALPGFYRGVRGVLFRGDVAAVAASDEHGVRLWIEGAETQLAPGGNDPDLIVFQDGVHCLWEADGAIHWRSASGSVRILPGGHQYRPRLVAVGDALAAVFERHDGARFRLLACTLGPDLGMPIELGLDAGNDQEAETASLGGTGYVAFENSRSMTKGYVYELFPEIIIPGFGHGWRVETRMYLAQLRMGEGGLESRLAALPLGAGKSSGRPLLAALDGALYGTYLDFDREVWPWRVSAFRVEEDAVQPLGSAKDASPFRMPAPLGFQAQPALSLQAAVTDIVTPILPQPGAPRPLAYGPWASRRAPQRPAPAPRQTLELAGETLPVWWGDLHMHSNVSVCSLHEGFHCTELEDKYKVCREVGQLDFAMCTDHDNMSDWEWYRTKRAADRENKPGAFVAFQGFEWTATMRTDKPNFGHDNVLYRTTGPLLRCDVVDTPEKMWAALAALDALTIPHHTGDLQHEFDWNHHDPRFRRLVEIFQVRGSYEYDGCPLDPRSFGRTFSPGRTVRDALLRGYRLGFTAGGEHEGVGVTAVIAKELTRDALFQALYNRRVYGTTGARMLLDFTIGGQPLGSELENIPVAAIRFSVQAAGELQSLRIVKDGECLLEQPFQGEEATLELNDPVGPGEHFYYAVVQRRDGEMGWASPIFIRNS